MYCIGRNHSGVYTYLLDYLIVVDKSMQYDPYGYISEREAKDVMMHSMSVSLNSYYELCRVLGAAERPGA